MLFIHYEYQNYIYEIINTTIPKEIGELREKWDMAELFVKQAKQYADARPSYPPQLFQFIASKTPSHNLVWDVGTGSGQAAKSVIWLSSSSLSSFFHFALS